MRTIRVAVDKIENIYKVKNAEVIYVFDKENYSELPRNVHCIHKDYINDVEINTTDYDIECIKKCSIYDDLSLPPKKDYKFAIIMPNCNYAEWLETSIKSILNQTYKNYEIIFVDDMSTDNSVEVARNLLKPPHKIIELQQKRYNGGARNEAYLHISKDVDYIWYIDSDDWIKDNRVLEDINNRLYGEPDVLFMGMDYCKNGQEYNDFIPEYKDRYEAIEGWSGSCGKVVKKELATRQECLYNEGTLKEDKNQHRRICIYMKSFKNLKRICYVWNRNNKKSVTTVREKVVWGTSTIRQYADTKQLYLSVKGKDEKMDKILEQKVARAKEEMESGGDGQY